MIKLFLIKKKLVEFEEWSGLLILLLLFNFVIILKFNFGVIIVENLEGLLYFLYVEWFL